MRITTGLAATTVRFQPATLRCRNRRRLDVFSGVEMVLCHDRLGTLVVMAPNTALRLARLALRLSQDEMAVAIRDAGQRLGTPNGCSKRLGQRWEARAVTLARAVYVRVPEDRN